jgi:hypothetical protein
MYLRCTVAHVFDSSPRIAVHLGDSNASDEIDSPSKFPEIPHTFIKGHTAAHKCVRPFQV